MDEDKYVHITYPVERYKGTAQVTIFGIDRFGVSNIDGPWTINGVDVVGSVLITKGVTVHAAVLRHKTWEKATESAYDKFLLTAHELVEYTEESRPYLVVEGETRRLKRELQSLVDKQEEMLSKVRSMSHAITDIKLALAGQAVKYQEAVEAHIRWLGAVPAVRVYQPVYDEEIWDERGFYSFMVYADKEDAEADFPTLEIEDYVLDEIDAPVILVHRLGQDEED